jgi:hypothetical protein
VGGEEKEKRREKVRGNVAENGRKERLKFGA